MSKHILEKSNECEVRTQVRNILKHREEYQPHCSYSTCSAFPFKLSYGFTAGPNPFFLAKLTHYGGSSN